MYLKKNKQHRRVATADCSGLSDETPPAVKPFAGGFIVSSPREQGSVEISGLQWEEARFSLDNEIVRVVCDSYQIDGIATWLPNKPGEGYAVSGTLTMVGETRGPGERARE